MGLSLIRAVAAFTLALALPAQAEEPPLSLDCFDVLVSARVAKQTPTAIPNCGADCIVMQWPWFVELDVDRVLEGVAPTGRVKVLTVQHTDIRTDKTFRWWLRRNTLGGFNARIAWTTKLPKCKAGELPAKPHIRPSKGQTLDDLERASDEA
jgi:hypothetical protein